MVYMHFIGTNDDDTGVKVIGATNRITDQGKKRALEAGDIGL